MSPEHFLYVNYNGFSGNTRCQRGRSGPTVQICEIGLPAHATYYSDHLSTFLRLPSVNLFSVYVTAQKTVQYTVSIEAIGIAYEFHFGAKEPQAVRKCQFRNEF